MPVKIPNDLPATKILQSENIFVMSESRAQSQDIRPLRIMILNLMPTQEGTETQLLRLLGASALQVDVTLLRTASHTSRNTSSDHLEAFYKTFDEVRAQKFDGLIITGAPVEQMDFREVDYWAELESILEWANGHVFSTLYICWAAQAGLYYRYGIEKYPLQSKRSGVYPHKTLERGNPMVRGFDDVFFAPHSRHTEVREEDILRVPDLALLSTSEKAGVYLAASRNFRHVFVTGHSEYDAETLKLEYDRDIAKGMDVPVPCNYFPDDDPGKQPRVSWRGHAHLLYGNWLNVIYQDTPYDVNEIGSDH